MTIFITLFCIAFTILAWKKLDWAILTLLFLLPSYLIRFHVFGLPMTLLESMILIVFLIWLIKNIKRLAKSIKENVKNRRIKLRYPWDIEIILLLLISFIAIGVAGWTNSAFGLWKAYFFEPILLFLVMANIFQSKKDFMRIVWALMFSALAVSLFGIFQYFTGLYISNPFWAAEATRRVTSVFEYPNAVALYLAPIIMLGFGWLLSIAKAKQVKVWLTIGLSLIIILSLLTIYFAQSEGALAALFLSFIIIGFFSNKKIAISTLVITIIIIAGVFSIAPIRNYATQKITMNDLSGQIRKLQWKETKQMLKEGDIFLGTGLGGYQSAIAPYHQEGFFYNFDNDEDFKQQTINSADYRATHWQPVEIYLYPHNIFLNFWTELGIVGALLFVWLILKYFVLAIRSIIKNDDKYFILGLGGAVLTMIIHGWVDVPYFKNDLAILFWVLFLILGMLSRQGRETKIQEIVSTN
ncbi:MAG: O-antigen ligase family protein [bacterium]